jgi:uncharacterized phage protein gp47/JayE
MTLKFDSYGVETNTYAELFTRLVDGYKVIYGPDIDVAQESPDGQKIGIEAALRFDIESAFAWLYSQIDPDLNNGDMQQIIAKLAGVYLLPASRSQWDLVVNSDRVSTLPSGYTITDVNNQNWFLDSAVTVAIGANNITFLSVLWGSVTGITSGSSYTQATPEPGIGAITSSTDATVGRQEETEEAFRVRRKRSIENPAQSTRGAIYAKMAQLAGVTDLQVYDNQTSVYEAARDLAAHTMWLVIEGGSLDDIGEVMAKQRLGGSKGAVNVTYTDTLTKPDGTPVSIISEAKIDGPTYLSLYIRLTATQRVSGSAVDIASVKAKLGLFPVEIGVPVPAGELYESSYIDNFNYIVSALEVSLNGSVWTDQEVTPGYAGKFTIDAANITVTEVAI